MLPNRATAPQALGDALRDFGPAAGLAAAALGGLVYMVLSIVCLVVYAPLGVVPADVGMSYSGTLLQTAICLVMVFASLAGQLLIYVVVAQLFAWTVGRPLGSGRLSALLGVLAVLLLAAGVAYVPGVVRSATDSDSDLWTGWTSLLVGLGLGFGLVAAGIGFPARAGEAVDPGADADAGRRRRLALPVRTRVLVGLGLAFVVAVAVLGASAAIDRQRLLDGRPTNDIVYPVPPPWDARVVHLAKHPDLEAEPSYCLLLLGQSDGVSVFYDANSTPPRTLRIDNQEIVVEILPDAKSTEPLGGGSGSCVEA